MGEWGEKISQADVENREPRLAQVRPRVAVEPGPREVGSKISTRGAEAGEVGPRFHRQ